MRKKLDESEVAAAGEKRAEKLRREAGAWVTPADIAVARVFWAYWGTPLFNAMLNAKAELERQ